MAENKLIAPLLLIPFLENSFKHGASQMLTHPWINLEIDIKEEELFLYLSNSKPVLVNEINLSGGLGLSNVKKRLSLLYPGSHILKIKEDLLSYSVELNSPLHIEMKKTDHSKKQILTDELV
jgi:LytS/YehU family sensor histidine kinase